MMDLEGSSVPVISLCLLAPPLRLMSAAMWKTMLQRDVSQYGRLEEFITNVSQGVPGLLDYRHYVKLVLGLRSRLILELCRDPEVLDTTAILTHLERLPALVQAAPNKPKRDLKVEMTLSNFQNLIQTLLEDPEERHRFFQEEFPEQYGAQYDRALEKLMWEFLTRLDQLLPVPDLAQTVSWLGSSPAFLDECAKSATQPQLLRNLLQHELLLGHTSSGLSIPSTTGDEVSMSLPPSGRIGETHQPGTDQTTASSVPSLPKSHQQKQRQTGPPIDPVIGSISLRHIQSAVPGAKPGEKSCQPEAHSQCDVEPDTPAQEFTKIRPKTCLRPAKAAGKKKEPIGRENDPVRVQAKDEVRVPRKRGRPRKREKCEEVPMVETKGKEGLENGTRDAGFASATTGGREDWTALLRSCLKRQPRVVIRRLEETEVALQRDGEVAVQRDSEVMAQRDSEVMAQRDSEVMAQRDSEVMAQRDSEVMAQRDNEITGQRDDRVTDVMQKRDELTTVLNSCIRHQLRVVIERLDMSSPAIQALLSGPPAAASEHKKRSLSRKKKGHVTMRKRKRTGLASPAKTLLSSENKENIEEFQIISQRTNSPGKAPMPAVSEEEMVGDSEDESSNSLKLFLKRYYRTKHNTFVPTLEEFVKPGLGRRDLSPGTGQRQ